MGGVLGVAALGALLIYLKRKHDNAAWTGTDGLSVYSGRSEKTHMPHGGIPAAPSTYGGLAPPPPGTYYATDDTGNLHLVMGYPSQASESRSLVLPPVAADSSMTSPVTRQTAPPGTLPEPVSTSSRRNADDALTGPPRTDGRRRRRPVCSFSGHSNDVSLHRLCYIS